MGLQRWKGDAKDVEFGSTICSLPDIDGKGTPGVLATEPCSLLSVCHVATKSRLQQSEVRIDCAADAHGVGLCATEIGDMDGDGVRDFAFGGVTWNGTFTGVVVIWSRTKGTLSELTLASIQRPAK